MCQNDPTHPKASECPLLAPFSGGITADGGEKPLHQPGERGKKSPSTEPLKGVEKAPPLNPVKGSKKPLHQTGEGAS